MDTVLRGEESYQKNLPFVAGYFGTFLLHILLLLFQIYERC